MVLFVNIKDNYHWDSFIYSERGSWWTLKLHFLLFFFCFTLLHHWSLGHTVVCHGHMMTRWLRCYMSSCLYQMFSSLQNVHGRFTSTKWRTEYPVGFIVTPLMYYYVELNFYFWGSITEIFCKYPSSDCGIQSYRCKQMKSKLEVAFTNTSSSGEISVTSTRSLTVHVGCSCVHRWTKED